MSKFYERKTITKLTEKYHVTFVEDYDMHAETRKNLYDQEWKKTNWKLFVYLINGLAKR